MWSSLGELLVFLIVVVLILLGVPAGLFLTQLVTMGLSALPTTHLARERGGGRELAVVWAAWVLRLVAVVLVPVVGAAYVVAIQWLSNAGTVANLLLTLPLMATAFPVFLSPLFLWDIFALETVGMSFVAFAWLALAVGSVAGGMAVQQGLLQWRGSETMCSVSLGDNQSSLVGTALYTLDCAAADAPVEMWTDTRVSGERTRVVYDPSGLGGVAHEAELGDQTFTVRVASGATALWTVLSLGHGLMGIPLARNRNAWPWNA